MLRNVHARAAGSTQGGWATAGTTEDPDTTIVISVDGGRGVTSEESMVRVVAYAGSVRKMNHNPRMASTT